MCNVGMGAMLILILYPALGTCAAQGLLLQEANELIS